MTKDDGNFLSRWSQRKHEATLPVSEAPGDESAPPLTQSDAPVTEISTEEEFDVSSLPKLEDVIEGTDITGFMKKGVPENLRNAALRKSWALDPAIRNYVNPALEYAYDWNTPGGVPGSSELAAGMDVAKMVLQIMGDGESLRAVAGSDTPNFLPRTGENVSTPAPPAIAAAQPSDTDLPTDTVRSSVTVEPPAELSADSQPAGHPELENIERIKVAEVGASQQAVRRHGSAKPAL